jgi:hypothetical protein
MPGDRFIELAMAEDRHVLDVLFRHASGGVTVQEPSGRLIYANDQAAALMGLSSGRQMVETPPTELLADLEMVDEAGNPLSVKELPGRRVIRGEESVEMTLGYRRKGSHQVRWSRVTASPIKNDARETVWVVNFLLDVTHEFRRAELQRVLSQAHEALGQSLDIDANLRALASIVVPHLGTWCGVSLVDDDGHVTRVAVEFPDTVLAEELRMSGWGRTELASDELEASVIRTGRPGVIEKVTSEMLEALIGRGGPETADLAKRLGFVSVACVPLKTSGEVVGALTVARSHPDRGYDDADIDLLNSLGEAAGVAITNARLYAQEREIAETLQQGLVPTELPSLDGLDVAVRYEPLAPMGRLGGDFFDVIVRSPDEVVIFIGDIEGKGIHSAAMVTAARHTLSATIALDPSPSIVFWQLNEVMRSRTPAKMCTLAYLVMVRKDDHFELSVALAGHPPPIVLSPAGELKAIGSPCPPAGVVPTIEPREEKVLLVPGDTLIAYTDGFAMGDAEDLSLLESILEGAPGEELETLLDRLRMEMRAAGPGPRDDMLLLALRVRPDPV